MTIRTDIFDLDQLALSSGEGRRLDLSTTIDDVTHSGEPYVVTGVDLSSKGDIPIHLDVSRTTHNGYALRLRFSVHTHGICFRCLDKADPLVEVDAHEVHQLGDGPELESPYMTDGELDVRHWARDALILSLPNQITCRPDCRGLCPQCGLNLNEDPDHTHEAEPDSRWAKLSEIRFDR